MDINVDQSSNSVGRCAGSDARQTGTRKLKYLAVGARYTRATGGAPRLGPNSDNINIRDTIRIRFDSDCAKNWYSLKFDINDIESSSDRYRLT